MEPTQPTKRAETLANAPAATPGDYEEYERLLAKRFSKDPSLQSAFHGAPDPDEARLQDLTRKLFGTS